MIKQVYFIRKARVFVNRRMAGYLLKNRSRFVYIYDKNYLAGGGVSIATTLPKSKRIFSSSYLFSYFSGLLPEGENKTFICNALKLDPNDKFAMLLALAQSETIGNVTVQEFR